MLSKWFDSCANVAAFHYQSTRYAKVAPPAFGNYPDLETSFLERQRLVPEMTPEQYESKLNADMNSGMGTESGFMTFLKNSPKTLRHLPNRHKSQKKKKRRAKRQRMKQPDPKSISTPNSEETDISEDAYRMCILSARGKAGLSPADKHVEKELASPLLREAVHLFSLLSAVSMATLRNDVPGVHSPLTRYQPGVPFPPVDPDRLDKNIRQEFDNKSRFWTAVYFVLGLSQSDKHRTLYNHARPFPVLGGISDNEVEALRQVRGPCAKVSLCFMWIQEFITREQLNGGLGPIPSTIVSRCYQFASDGMRGYNDCRKVAYIPFPFVEAQLTTFFVTVLTWIVFPLLFFSYVNALWLACLLNFTTVLCFVGLQGVANEIENPFLHVPNNLPLTTFQAQYNEALITTWAGYHPDSWSILPVSDLPDLSDEGTSVRDAKKAK